MPLHRSLLLLIPLHLAAVAVSAPLRGETADSIYSGGEILTMRGVSRETAAQKPGRRPVFWAVLPTVCWEAILL